MHRPRRRRPSLAVAALALAAPVASCSLDEADEPAERRRLFTPSSPAGRCSWS